MIVIKSRTLVLKNGEKSSEVMLADFDGGNMYFTFELRYVENEEAGKTRFSPIDAHHANFLIDTLPNAITKPNSIIEIGTYGKNNTRLFVGYVVQPQIANSGEHNVVITFYTGKEGANGSNNI